MSDEDHEVEHYPEGITSNNAPIPKWLKFLYYTLPFWGILWFALYWNGSWGWLDRGSWSELQRAANTTFPFVNADSRK